jgi:UDP-N-acetylglucosamine:LPS N-acetylglucosamine transferase
MARNQTKKKLLAVASGGGHWVQLLRLRRAFEGCDSVFVTVVDDYRADVAGHRFYCVCDATRHTWIRLVRASIEILFVILRERPDIIISTGAAPGYVAIRIGRLLGAKAIWVDSIANVEQMSMSGTLAGRHVDLWLTQWPHLAKESGPHFRGAVL